MALDAVTRTYDPKAVIITFGTVIMTGFIDGTFLTAEYDGDAFEKVRGADGSVNRINKNIFDGVITCTVMQSSPTNTELSTIHAQDKIANTGVLPFIVKELNGTTLVNAPQAWIRKQAPISFGNTVEGREWTFDTGVMSAFTGGTLV